MGIQTFVAGRILLLVPIAIILALIIVTDSAFYRAILIAGLVMLELIRDVFSVSEATKISREAARLPPKVRRAEK